MNNVVEGRNLVDTFAEVVGTTDYNNLGVWHLLDNKFNDFAKWGFSCLCNLILIDAQLILGDVTEIIYFNARIFDLGGHHCVLLEHDFSECFTAHFGTWSTSTSFDSLVTLITK